MRGDDEDEVSAERERDDRRYARQPGGKEETAGETGQEDQGEGGPAMRDRQVGFRELELPVRRREEHAEVEAEVEQAGREEQRPREHAPHAGDSERRAGRPDRWARTMRA